MSERESYDEIEITPEMTAAGLVTLFLYSPAEDSIEFAREIVEAIYREMQKLRPRKTVGTVSSKDETFEDFQREATRRFSDGPFRKP